MGIIVTHLGSFLTVMLCIQERVAFDANRTPYGPRMCRYLCHHTGGYCVFTESTLSCHVMGRNKMVTLKHRDVLFNVTQVKQHCPGLSKLVESRNKGPKWICTSNGRKEVRDVRRSLLITQYTRKPLAFHQFFFENRSIGTYDFIKETMVIAITYVSRLQKVLVSRHRPSMIVSYDLNSSTGKKISSKSSLSMVVDEGRQLVFFTVYLRKGIVQMTTAGREPAHLTIRSTYIRLALDPKRQTIYATCNYNIVLLTYNGTQEKIIVEKVNMYAITFDSLENVLYYCSSEALHKLPRSGAKHKVLDVGGTFQNLIKYGEDIYATFEDRNELTRIILKTPTITDSYTIDVRDKRRMAICAAP